MRKQSVVHAMREVVTGRRTAGGNEGQDRLPRRQGRIADGDQTFVPLRGLGSRQGANKGLHRLQRSRDRSGWPPLPAQRQVRHDCADRRPHARRRHAALTTAWRLCDLRASRKASRSATHVDRRRHGSTSLISLEWSASFPTVDAIQLEIGVGPFTGSFADGGRNPGKHATSASPPLSRFRGSTYGTL